MSSQWEYIPQGDTEAMVIDILENSTEIDNFPGGPPTVSSDYTGYSMGARWIMVSREGGFLRWPHVDKPRIDLYVLAETRSVAHDLAQVAQAVIRQAMGQAFPTYGVVLSDVQVETGITRVPDKETGSPRYVLALRLACVPS